MMKRIEVNLVNPMNDASFSHGVGASISSHELSVFNSSKYAVFPGFCDVHVHFREPGFSYKETMHSGSLASARGGYTAVCTMPNLNPVPDSVENLHQQLKLIEAGACIHVYPYGAITVGEKGEELADLEGMAPNVIGFSDDGRGVQQEQMMRQAMEDYRSADEKLLAELGRNPTEEELAQALHMTVAETAVVAEMLETARRLQYAKQEPEPEEEPEEEPPIRT